MLSFVPAAPFSFCAGPSFPVIVPRPGARRLVPLVSLSPFSHARMALQVARVEKRGAPLSTFPLPDIPPATVERGLRQIPFVKGFLSLPNGLLMACVSAGAAMAGASVISESPEEAAAAKKATADRAASEAAASEEAASEEAASEDFKYRATSELVSEKLGNKLFSGSSEDPAMAKDFFNEIFLGVRKNSADLSNLNTRVEEIATRTTTNELVLENNNQVKKAMTQAVTQLAGTSFVTWVFVDSWASLATKKIATIVAVNIAAAMYEFLKTKANVVSAYKAGGSHAYKVGRARELA